MENWERRRNRRQTETHTLGLQSLVSGAPGLESYPSGFSHGGSSLRVAVVGTVLELVVTGAAVEAKLLCMAALLLLGRERAVRTLARRVYLHGGRFGRTAPRGGWRGRRWWVVARARTIRVLRSARLEAFLIALELDLKLMQVVIGLDDGGDPVIEGGRAFDVDKELPKIRLEAAHELIDFNLLGPVNVRETFDVLVREVGGGALLHECLDAARVLADEVGGLEALNKLSLECFPVREERGLCALDCSEPRLWCPGPEVHGHIVDLVRVAGEGGTLKVHVGLDLVNELLDVVGLAREVLGLADLNGWDAASGRCGR